MHTPVLLYSAADDCQDLAQVIMSILFIICKTLKQYLLAIIKNCKV